MLQCNKWGVSRRWDLPFQPVRLRPVVTVAALALIGSLACGQAGAQEPPGLATDDLVQRLTAAIGAAPEELPEGVRFIVRFDQDVSGLSVGAPVTVKGLRVGTVREVAVVIDSTAAVIDVPVVIDVVPERITVDGGTPENAAAVQDLAARLVAGGLRAGLESATPLGGPQRVTLAFVPDAEPAELGEGGRYPEIPTAPSLVDELRGTLETLLERMAALPLEQVVAELTATLAELRALVTAPEIREMLDTVGAVSDELRSLIAGPELREALSAVVDAGEELRALAAGLDARLEPSIGALQRAAGSIETAADQSTVAISGLEQTIGPRSPLWDELLQTSRELAGTTRALRLLIEYLERHPDALIRGRQETQP
jgi:paraquat-inducible protein B